MCGFLCLSFLARATVSGTSSEYGRRPSHLPVSARLRSLAILSLPKEEDSFRIDAIWMYPFEIAGRSFSIEGHVAYVGERRNEFGEEVSWSILGQPQFRYDLGKDLFGRPERLFVGFEWQFWINKQGDSDTDENALQLLVVGRF